MFVIVVVAVLWYFDVLVSRCVDARMSLCVDESALYARCFVVVVFRVYVTRMSPECTVCWYVSVFVCVLCFVGAGSSVERCPCISS